jgi:hypothetical protein
LQWKKVNSMPGFMGCQWSGPADVMACAPGEAAVMVTAAATAVMPGDIAPGVMR